MCPQPRAVLGERVGLKGSLFPRVIIPEQRNRNVLKTPRWTFLTGAGAFGCTVAPLFPSMRLEQPDHLLHPPLPQNNQAVIKKQVFSLQYWAKCPQASPLPRADRATLRQQGQGQQVSRCLWHWEHPQHPGPSQSHGDIHGDSCPSLPMPNPTGGKGQGGRQAEKEGEEKKRGGKGKKEKEKKTNSASSRIHQHYRDRRPQSDGRTRCRRGIPTRSGGRSGSL